MNSLFPRIITIIVPPKAEEFTVIRLKPPRNKEALWHWLNKTFNAQDIDEFIQGDSKTTAITDAGTCANSEEVKSFLTDRIMKRFKTGDYFLIRVKSQWYVIYPEL